MMENIWNDIVRSRADGDRNLAIYRDKYESADEAGRAAIRLALAKLCGAVELLAGDDARRADLGVSVCVLGTGDPDAATDKPVDPRVLRAAAEAWDRGEVFTADGVDF